MFQICYVEDVRGFVFSGQEINLLSNTTVSLSFCGFVTKGLNFSNENFISVTKVVL